MFGGEANSPLDPSRPIDLTGSDSSIGRRLASDRKVAGLMPTLGISPLCPWVISQWVFLCWSERQTRDA